VKRLELSRSRLLTNVRQRRQRSALQTLRSRHMGCQRGLPAVSMHPTTGFRSAPSATPKLQYAGLQMDTRTTASAKPQHRYQRHRARLIQMLHRAVSLACATQDIRGRMAEHAKLAALGRTRNRLAPAPALHARQANIPRGAPSASCPCLDQSHERIEQKLLRVRVSVLGPEWRAVHGVSGGQVQDRVGSRIVQQLPLGYNLETHTRTIDCDDADGYLALLVRIP